MRILVFIYCLFLSLFVFSQSSKEKGLNIITRDRAEACIGFLADDALEGREAGKRGSIIAARYIESQLKESGIKPFRESYCQPFDTYGIERQGRIRYTVNTDSIVKYKQMPAFQKRNLTNILGCIEGRRKDEYVIIGAHYDHLGKDDTLTGDKIYNGADDNASGVSAVLQIAKAFIASGEKPLRTVIFAFWDGEELGLLGSEYFAGNFTNISEIKGYINFDMIGRNNDESNPTQVVYFYSEQKPEFKDWIESDIANYNLKLKSDYKSSLNSLRGSDNASFNKRNIPVIWYHTDGHPDYHQPSDHADKINWEKLVDITKAAYLNLWNMANLENY
ncbi:hypothetical protein GGR21_002568 [Dysgonomonas hofstadii]|uniref:Peptidase M28 domain-containing protein n=1 Tax=Dysgonomonas hofstadii TaxID=637886 RepID=A0A840CW09_9BACT|nr:M20/M25/M40 family metallo-hydrolase [Dysgonomonas hofstadii]MBB4036662.1 hypothetical protein [Dysgonomonas hofstadii]